MHPTFKAAPSLLVTALLAALPAVSAHAAALGYGGRLVDAEGAPLAGPVDLTVRFFASEAGGDPLGASLSFAGVPLTGGVFQVSLILSEAEQEAIFGDGSRTVYVEIEAGGRIYPRQSFAAVPLALRVPVDNDSLVYGEGAKLAVGQVRMSQVVGLDAALAAQQAELTPSTSVSVGSLITAQQNAVLIKPFGAAANETGELRFAERSGDHFVGFKAPDAVAADRVWTLPGADGALGSVLVTDGAGGLSWAPVDSAAVVDGSLADADIAASAAIADTKLATIATPGKVAGGSITSGSIGGTTAFTGSGGVATAGAIAGSGNFLVNGTGAATTELRFGDDDNSNFIALKAPGTVAASKVYVLPAADGGAGQFLTTNGAGVLAWGSPAGGGDLMASANLSDLANVSTARSNLGLGSLATLSSVGSAEISDAAIADADISGTAAIATSKLSGPLTSISGHGLGALATLSSIGTSDISDGSITNADVAGSAAIATSKLSGTVTSISGHGLGALATLSAVGSSEIANGAIADADVSGTAAIATSKLSGSITSIAGHGLGSLATLSMIGSGEIADGAIADADVSGTAAIATSKLSGAVTSIAGHGLGSLASLSAVGTSEITDGSIADADISGSAAISSSKISFVSDGISGDKIHGGTISSFASTGIDDNASATAVTLDAAGNVGIGTTAPDNKLSVIGSANVTGAVGVGTTSPAAQLQVGADTTDGRLYVNGGSSGATPLTTARPTTDDGQILIGRPGATSADSGGLEFLSSPAGAGYGWKVTAPDVSGATSLRFHSRANSATWTERLTLTNSGNIGIGTTSPAYILDIAGTAARIKSSTGNTLLLLENSTAGINNWSVKTGTAGWQVRDETNSQTRLVVDNVGNVGVGTTAPSNTLTVQSSTQFMGLQVRNATNRIAELVGGSAVNEGGILALYNDASQDVNIRASGSSWINGGNVGIGTTVPAAKLQVTGQVAVTMPASNVPAGTTQTVDWNQGNLQVVDLSSAAGNVTLTLSNPVAGASYGLKIIQGANARNIVWPAAVKWPGGVPFSVSTVNGAVDFVTLFYDGSSYYAAAGKNYQ